MKFKEAKQKADRTKPPVDIAIPTYGYQNHVLIDAGFGFIRKWQATDAALYEGAVLRKGLLDKTNTTGKVWVDTAYRSRENEGFMDDNGFVSCVHRKKPKGKPMSEATRGANNLKSKVRSHAEHVFAEQKEPDGAVYPDYWYRQGDDQDRLGQPRLQHQTADLPGMDSGSIGGNHPDEG